MATSSESIASMLGSIRLRPELRDIPFPFTDPAVSSDPRLCFGRGYSFPLPVARGFRGLQAMRLLSTSFTPLFRAREEQHTSPTRVRGLTVLCSGRGQIAITIRVVAGAA